MFGALTKLKSAANDLPYTSQVVLGLFGQCSAQASKVARCFLSERRVTQCRSVSLLLSWLLTQRSHICLACVRNVLELCLHCLWKKKTNKQKPSWSQAWFCHASAAGVWSSVARPALTSSSPQHHPISPSGTSSHCQVCGLVRSVRQCIVLFVCVCVCACVCVYMEMDRLIWWRWSLEAGTFSVEDSGFLGRLIWQSCLETDAVSLVMVIIHQKVSIFDEHVVSKQGLFVRVFIACFQCWVFDSLCRFALFKPTASKKSI